MTYARKVDANQAVIKAAFVRMGCSVLDLSAHGRGVPDLLVGACGENILVEVKSLHGKLNGKQHQFIAAWSGRKAIARCVEDAAIIVADMGERARKLRA